jgi:hypothetical protein
MFLILFLGITFCAATDFSYSYYDPITSWEFQLDTNVNDSTMGYYDNLTLNLYKQYATDAKHKFTYKKDTVLSKFNIKYWSIQSALPNSTEHVLMKQREWVVGPRVNTTDLTIKFKHTPLSEWTPLPNPVPTLESKLENDVHCLFNAVSYSVLNPSVPTNLIARTLRDLLPYFSPDLGTYLNMSLDSEVTPGKTGFGLEGNVEVKFNYESKSRVIIKGDSTMQYEYMVDPVTKQVVTNKELSIRVKRLNYNASDLVPALNENTKLFNFLANSVLNNGSCTPLTNPPTELPFFQL